MKKAFAFAFWLFILWPYLWTIQSKSSQDNLTIILNKSSEYCRKSADSALYFVCQERINEEIYEFPGSDFRPPARRKTIKNSFIYDYQLVKKGQSVEETRTLIEENNQMKNQKDALLKTQRFISRKAIFGPVGFLGREWRDVYDYKLLKQYRVDGQDVYVIEVKPKVPIEGKPNYGKIWVDKKDFSVLKIEVEDRSLVGFEKALDLAKRYGVIPAFITIHEYEIITDFRQLGSHQKIPLSRNQQLTSKKSDYSLKSSA